METTLEVLTTRRSRREAHRQWPDEMKANYLSSWRTLARQGKLVLPEPKDVVEFSAMVVETPAPEPPFVKVFARAEIVVGPVTIRLEESAFAARIAVIARALAAAI